MESLQLCIVNHACLMLCNTQCRHCLVKLTDIAHSAYKLVNLCSLPLAGDLSNMAAITVLTHLGDNVSRDNVSSLGMIQRWKIGRPGLSKAFSNCYVHPWEFTLVGTKNKVSMKCTASLLCWYQSMLRSFFLMLRS